MKHTYNKKEPFCSQKQLILLFFMAILATVTSNAQNPRERMEAMKIGFITQRLSLTPEEAQRFWPVYNKFSDEQQNLKKFTRGMLMEDLADPDRLSNADADKVLNEMIQYKYNEVDLIKKYASEFKKVLPVQKVVMLFKAEMDFKKEILKRLKERDRN